MSRLETQAQPLIQPLLSGDRTVIDSASQALIAMWAVKTSMVLEAIDPPEQRVYPRTECERLRTLSAVPWRTSVWICKSIDPSVFMSTKTRHVPAVTTPTVLGASVTIALSHLVLQVFTIRVHDDVGPATRVTVDARRGPWQQLTLQIWPSQKTSVLFPAAMGLDGVEGIDLLAERFNTADSNADIEPIDV